MKTFFSVMVILLCVAFCRAEAYTPDEMLVVLGFTITIDNAGTGSDPDSAWETCSGGALNIEVADSSIASDPHHTTAPGHRYMDTLSNLRISGKDHN
ncbi:MAG: hypothetical protein RBT16_13260, partial [Desulfococcus multivorans]|nr:hypothetical protein [Desulfococcus multivorans]